MVPDIDEKKCTYCRTCAEFCQFNALFIAGDTALVFPELCHSCGGCKLVCPEKAITEKKRSIGKIYAGITGVEGLNIVYGELNIGEPLAVPVISSVKKQINKEGLVILDSPPGSACPVVESVSGADFCIMVTEPTPFGLSDLKLTVEIVKDLSKKVAIVINKYTDSKIIDDYARTVDIPVVMRIPYSIEIQRSYSEGIPLVDVMPEMKKEFTDLIKKLV